MIDAIRNIGSFDMAITVTDKVAGLRDILACSILVLESCLSPVACSGIAEKDGQDTTRENEGYPQLVESYCCS